ncbi:MAG: hypothetical protein ABFC80_09740, partial [Coriobacteriales bacterium]
TSRFSGWRSDARWIGWTFGSRVISALRNESLEEGDPEDAPLCIASGVHPPCGRGCEELAEG